MTVAGGDDAGSLFGLARNISQHAAGVIFPHQSYRFSGDYANGMEESASSHLPGYFEAHILFPSGAAGIHPPAAILAYPIFQDQEAETGAGDEGRKSATSLM